MTILDIKQQDKIRRKEIILYIFYAIIILQMILLIPSYYVGWWKADYYHDEKLDYLQCFSVYHNWENCKELYTNLRLEDKKISNNFIILNFLLKNNFNIFSNQDLNKETILELEEFHVENKIRDSINIFEGEISEVNEISVTNNNKISIKDEVVVISGHILVEKSDNVEVVYLTSNQIPIAKFDNFYEIDKTQTETKYEMIWNFAILENYLPEECKEISVVGIINDLPFALNDHIEICS